MRLDKLGFYINFTVLIGSQLFNFYNNVKEEVVLSEFYTLAFGEYLKSN